MNDVSAFADGFVNKLLEAGLKTFDSIEAASKINLTVLKQAFDSHLELGTALADFGAAQFKSVRDFGSANDVLQRQTEAFQALGSKVQSYVEELRGAAQEAQQSWVALGQGVAADLSKGYKPAA